MIPRVWNLAFGFAVGWYAVAFLPAGRFGPLAFAIGSAAFALGILIPTAGWRVPAPIVRRELLVTWIVFAIVTVVIDATGWMPHAPKSLDERLVWMIAACPLAIASGLVARAGLRPGWSDDQGSIAAGSALLVGTLAGAAGALAARHFEVGSVVVSAFIPLTILFAAWRLGCFVDRRAAEAWIRLASAERIMNLAFGVVLGLVVGFMLDSWCEPRSNESVEANHVILCFGLVAVGASVWIVRPTPPTRLGLTFSAGFIVCCFGALTNELWLIAVPVGAWLPVLVHMPARGGLRGTERPWLTVTPERVALVLAGSALGGLRAHQHLVRARNSICGMTAQQESGTEMKFFVLVVAWTIFTLFMHDRLRAEGEKRERMTG